MRSLLFVVLAPLFAFACSSTTSTGAGAPDASTPDPQADAGAKDDAAKADAAPAAPVGIVFETDLGNIELELDPEHAPKTTANFLQYVDEKHFDGLLFHRVIPGFMIQGGGYDASYKERDTHDPIKNEADNGLKNLRGTISMARTSDPDSATSQFFISVADNPKLDFTAKTEAGWGYAVFGKVTVGMDVADKIVAVPTGKAGPFTEDAPQTPITIKTAHRR
jgi:cyclophilin family peptidyl-prolyl cis-trans isomerase